MTISLLDRITTHVETIDARAATIDPRRVLAGVLYLLTLPFLAVGIVVAVVWTILRWSIAGVLDGFELTMRTVDRLSQPPARGG